MNLGLKVCLMNVHRLLIFSIMVASNFVEDKNCRKSYFANVGGISAMESNSLELNFHFLVKFKQHVSFTAFESYCTHLEREVSFDTTSREASSSRAVERSLLKNEKEGN